MARSYDSDPLGAYSFFLVEIPSAGLPAFPQTLIANKGVLSFQSISMPTLTIQTKKYQEGNNPFQHTIIQNQVQCGDVKLKKAVTSLNVDFYQWFLQAISGDRSIPGIFPVPRRHFMIVHTRADRSIPARSVILWDCIPIELKPSSDLDANQSQLCIEELTISPNRFDIVPGFGIT